MTSSCIVLLLSVACVLLSVVSAQTCPSSGIVCSPGNCCPGYQLCFGTTFYPLQATAPGTVCKDGAIAFAYECADTPCASAPTQPTNPPQPTTAPTSLPTPPPVAPITRAPIAPTYVPATIAPTYAPAPTQAPAPTAVPTSAPTQAPAPTAVPTSAPTATPTKAPTPAPTVSSTSGGGNGGSGSSSGNGFGQLLMAYYSGVALETVGAGGINALAMAFFDPTPLGTGTCDFTDTNTRCVQPAVNSGNKNLAWALAAMKQAVPLLSPNTSPVRNGKPTIYFSFGGQTQGGACWDALLGNANTATTFGTNAALLVTTVTKTLRDSGYNLYVGFDLDIEETTTALPYIQNFVNAFRAIAPYDQYPLQLCSLSGLANPSNDDYFKIGIMQQMGPAQKGINFLNMMVANADVSCQGMQNYWMDPALSFIPTANKIFGMWGELLPTWILHEPGCTSGGSPLFPMMKQSGVGVGIWQWWVGSSDGITGVLNQIRSG